MPIIPKKTRRVVIAGLFGTLLEWYDFSVYVYLAPVMAKLFFPADNAYISLLLTYLIFTLGYLIRPLGGVIFGHLGDRFGRKRTLITIILLMSIPTFLIGLLPTYQQIGIAAPLLLALFRILQGLSAGGELIGCTAYAAESAPNHRRGLVSSIVWVASAGGILLGSAVIALISGSFTTTSLESWGWRIPFWFGIIAGYIGYVLRSKLEESQAYIQSQKEGKITAFPLLTAWRNYKIAFLKVFVLGMLGAVSFYLIFVFMPTYSTHILHISLSRATAINSVMTFILIILTIFVGGLSDKVGRKPLLLTGAAGVVVFSLPLYYLMNAGTLLTLSLGQLGFAVLIALYSGPLMAFFLELVPTHVRYSLVAVSYNLCYAIFGGTAPLIATYLIHKTAYEILPAFYLILIAVIVMPVVFLTRDNFRKNL